MNKSCFSQHSTGLFETKMKLDTKKYIYDTYCRHNLTYGWEFLPQNEKIKKEQKDQKPQYYTDFLKSIKSIEHNNI